MKPSSVVSVAALADSTAAKKCQNITVTVDISARQGLFNLSIPQNNIEVTNFALNLAQAGVNFTEEVLTKYQTTSGSYKLATTYCEPDWGYSEVVQLLTHGLGFDRSYWDIPFNNYNYSYVDVATGQYNYSTFTWDRLGIGMSEHGDPLNEIQAYIEVAALAALTEKLRNGSIAGVRRYNKVVHVGHSFGSQHTYLLTAMYPNISDGIALTGFSKAAPGVPEFALGNNLATLPAAASASYPLGYVAPNALEGVHIAFLSPNSFDPAILTYAFETGQPVTVGELLTVGGEIGVNNTFAGPVLIITGERDIPYCAGNCYANVPSGYSNLPEAAFAYIPDAKNPVAYVVNGTGHGLNLEYSFPETYAAVNDYFSQQKGLEARGW